MKYAGTAAAVLAVGATAYQLSHWPEPIEQTVTRTSSQTQTVLPKLGNDFNAIEDAIGNLYPELQICMKEINLLPSETKIAQTIATYIAANSSDLSLLQDLILQAGKNSWDGAFITAWNQNHQSNETNDEAGQNSMMCLIKDMQEAAIADFPSSSALQRASDLFPEAFETARRLQSALVYQEAYLNDLRTALSLYNKYAPSLHKKYGNRFPISCIPGSSANTGAGLGLVGTSDSVASELDITDEYHRALGHRDIGDYWQGKVPPKAIEDLKGRLGKRELINIHPDLETIFDALVEKMPATTKSGFLAVAQSSPEEGFYPLNVMLRLLQNAVEDYGSIIVEHHANRIGNCLLRGTVVDVETLNCMSSPQATQCYRTDYGDNYHSKNLELEIPDHLKLSPLKVGAQLMNRFPRFRYPDEAEGVMGSIDEVWKKMTSDCTTDTAIFNIVMRNMGVRMNTLREYFLSPKASSGGQTAYGHYVSVVIDDDGKRYVFDGLGRTGPYLLDRYISDRRGHVFEESYPSGYGSRLVAIYEP